MTAFTADTTTAARISQLKTLPIRKLIASMTRLSARSTPTVPSPLGAAVAARPLKSLLFAAGLGAGLAHLSLKRPPAVNRILMRIPGLVRPMGGAGDALVPRRATRCRKRAYAGLQRASRTAP